MAVQQRGPTSILHPAVYTVAALSLATMVARADERDVQFDRWFAAQTNLQSWSADFTQTRSLKVLAQPLVSTGKVWVAPGRFRWELGQPAQTIVLRQPDQLLIIYPRLKRAEKYPLERRAARAVEGRAGVAGRQPPPGSGIAWKNAFACCRRRKRTRCCK